MLYLFQGIKFQYVGSLSCIIQIWGSKTHRDDSDSVSTSESMLGFRTVQLCRHCSGQSRWYKIALMLLLQCGGQINFLTTLSLVSPYTVLNVNSVPAFRGANGQVWCLCLCVSTCVSERVHSPIKYSQPAFSDIIPNINIALGL